MRRSRRRRTARHSSHLRCLFSVFLVVSVLGVVEVVAAQTIPPPVPAQTTPPPQVAPSAPTSPGGDTLAPLPPPGPRPAAPRPPSAPSPTPPPTTIPSVIVPGALRRALPILPSVTGFELHPLLSVSEEYTDNFSLTPRNRQEDFRSTLSPGALLLINGARTRGQLAYTFSPSYDTATDDVSYFHEFDGRVRWDATPRLALTATDTLTRSDDPRQGDRLGLRRGRSTFTSNELMLTSDYRIGNLPTQQYYQLSTFSDEGGADTITHTAGATVSPTFYTTNTATLLGYEYINSRTSEITESGHEVRASVARRAMVHGWVGLEANYAIRTVTGDAENPASDYTLWGVTLFNSYGIPGKWSLNGSVGYSRLSPDRGEDQSDITSETTATYQFARGIATLTYERGFSETFRQGQNFGVVKTEGIMGALLYSLTPFIAITTTASYRVDELPKNIASQEPRETDKLWSVTMILDYRILRWLSLELEYTYTDATSNDRERAYRENRGRVTLNAIF